MMVARYELQTMRASMGSKGREAGEVSEVSESVLGQGAEFGVQVGG